MKIGRLLTLALIVSTVACTQSAPPEGSAPATPAAQAQSSPVLADQKDPSGMLTLSPGAIDLCTAVDGAIAMDVSWDATQANTDGIKIFLKDPSTGEDKLWLAAPAQGHDKTGVWMREGTVVRLVNANTDTDLAKLTVTSVNCNR